MTTPIEVFDLIRAKGETMLQVAFLESGRPWPDDAGTVAFMKTVLGIGIAAASEHYAEHPEHIAVAGDPICEVCREPVQTMQLGADPSASEENTTMVRIVWPCGHIQPSVS